MLPSSHIATGVLLFVIFQLLGVNPIFAVFAIIGAVLPDVDYVTYKNHRTRTTHAPLLWFIALTPLSIVYQPFIFLEIGVFVHLLLDTLDWGIMWLHPYRTQLYGGIMRKKNIRSNFTRHYLAHSGFVALESVFGVAAILLSYLVLL